MVGERRKKKRKREGGRKEGREGERKGEREKGRKREREKGREGICLNEGRNFTDRRHITFSSLIFPIEKCIASDSIGIYTQRNAFKQFGSGFKQF